MAAREPPVVAVAGGGITGLAACWRLAGAGTGLRVVLLERSSRLGGKIRTEDFDGRPVDVGPDALLSRVPEGADLCRELDLGDDLVTQATVGAFLWTRGRLRRLPPGLVLGMPTDLVAVARSGVLGPLGLARAGLDLVLPRNRPVPGHTAGEDRSVGEVVRERFGEEALQRLVDPLIGGIHAGRSEELSLAATAPVIDSVSRSSRSLLLGLRNAQRAAPSSGGAARPAFLSLRGGLGTLVERLSHRLSASGAELRIGTAATAVTRAGSRWEVGTTDGPLVADGVVIATPAPQAATLLAGCVPVAASELAGIASASVSLVTLAYDSSSLPGPLEGSGFLVPRAEGRLLTACTWSTSKWPHLARAGRVVLRASAGRAGDTRAMTMGDDELVSRLHAELTEAMGLGGPPLDSLVTRWPGSFPQYRVGHLDKVARIEEAVATAPGLAVAGAALRGMGIPACIAQGYAAADSLLRQLSLPVAAGDSPARP